MNRYARLAMKPLTRAAVADSIFGKKLTRPITAGVKTMFNRQRMNGPRDVRDLLDQGPWVLSGSSGLMAGLGGLGEGGEVEAARAAVIAAEAKVRTLQAEVVAQKALVKFTERRVVMCTPEGGDAGAIVGGFATGGAYTLACIAAAQLDLGQQRGGVATLEHKLSAAKTELANAQAMYADMKATSPNSGSQDLLDLPSDDPGSIINQAARRLGPRGPNSLRGPNGMPTATPMWQSPIAIGGAVLVVGGLALYLLKRK